MINLILNGDKLSIKFHKFGKRYSKKSKSILVHLDYDLPKNNRILDIGKKKLQLELSNINNLEKGMRIRINVEDLERNGTE